MAALLVVWQDLSNPPALLEHCGDFPSRTPSRIQPAVGVLHPHLAVVSSVSDTSQAAYLSLRGKDTGTGRIMGSGVSFPTICGLYYMVLGRGKLRHSVETLWPCSASGPGPSAV